MGIFLFFIVKFMCWSIDWAFIFQVRDQDVPVMRNYARIVINVTDTNDHAPWFTSSFYEGRVYESAAVGSSVLQVTALDKDKGKNAEVIYSIESGTVYVCDY